MVEWMSLSLLAEEAPKGLLGANDNSDSVIVECVYQSDEPPSWGLDFQVELRHRPDDDCVEHLGHLQVVASS